MIKSKKNMTIYGKFYQKSKIYMNFFSKSFRNVFFIYGAFQFFKVCISASTSTFHQLVDLLYLFQVKCIFLALKVT